MSWLVWPTGLPRLARGLNGSGLLGPRAEPFWPCGPQGQVGCVPVGHRANRWVPVGHRARWVVCRGATGTLRWAVPTVAGLAHGGWARARWLASRTVVATGGGRAAGPGFRAGAGEAGIRAGRWPGSGRLWE